MATKIKFGTDGWRGHVAEDYTFETVRRCAQGFASYLLEEGNAGKWVIVGYDKRFRSEDFADAVKAGASAVSAGSMFVFHGVHRAVLITYPSKKELEKIFSFNSNR